MKKSVKTKHTAENTAVYEHGEKLKSGKTLETKSLSVCFLQWFGIRMPNVSIVKISLFSSCVNADMGPKDLDWII